MSIIDQLISKDIPTVAEIETRYPARIEKAACVTRIAPSPTGFMHIGGVYAALISERIAHQQDGTFFLRIEDTDASREVEGATDLIVKAFNDYGIKTDEGVFAGGEEKGDYGPYIQSKRKEVYQAYIRDLLEKGMAYPCFCTAEELEKIRETQKSFSKRTGYYGEWALHRSLSEDEIKEKLAEGLPFVIRFKSKGSFDEKVVYNDLVKGRMSMPQSDMDVVIMKASGIPTYHFAHIIDDHLMGTTHVVRGDEWLASTPLHIQLFEAMGWKAPEFGHIAPIQKMDEGSKRKLSKRKDVEAGMAYYAEKGYEKEVVLEYLMNLANSSFEGWRAENPDVSVWDFPFQVSGLGKSGALLDLAKLDNISKEYIASLSAEEVYSKLLLWAEAHDAVLSQRMLDHKDYFISIFEIERKGAERVRKDFACWSEVWNEISYFFDDQYEVSAERTAEVFPENRGAYKTFLETYVSGYNHEASKDDWFPNMKELALEHKFAKSPKVFKKEPESYIGSIADAAKTIRMAVTGRENAPDLYAVLHAMGEERVRARFDGFLKLM